jgi:nucleoside-diphosphate-sugar epimerase
MSAGAVSRERPIVAGQSRVLVTGGAGFLGGHVVRALRARGTEVVVLARPPRDARGSAARAALASLGAEIAVGDVLDAASLRRALAGATTVFHLAGRLFAPGIPDADFERVHVEGSRHLLEACAESSTVRSIVHCSTTGVLGPTGQTPLDEDAAPRPSNAYERSKAEGEGLARALAGRHGLPLVVARPALVYGPGDVHLLGWFRAIRRGVYRVVGDGDNLVHPIFVDDCVTGLLLCAETQGAPAGRAYNLVGEEAVPIREMARAIAAVVGRPLPRGHLPKWLAHGLGAVLEALPGVAPARLPLTRSRVAFMTESRAYSGGRARNELGFVPRVGLAQGLERTVAWYRAEGLL